MKIQGERLGAGEIHAIAQFLTGKAVGDASGTQPEANNCNDHPPIDFAATQWNGWGRDLDNSRYQPDPGFGREDVRKLKVKWAFGYPGIMTYGQPTIMGDRLFVSSMTGRVFSLNVRTGCTYWSFDARAGVRTAISISALLLDSSTKLAAYFADEQGFVYAVDAMSEQLFWQMKPDEHPLARIIGAPAFDSGRLYVPVSSPEEAVSRNPNYPCCTFRGSVSALDAATGKLNGRLTRFLSPEAVQEKCGGHTNVRTRRSRDLVRADHRPQTPRALCRYRQLIHRVGNQWHRRDSGD
jgi:polyvinyl alcohol dehydrogenase (cytochrome)